MMRTDIRKMHRWLAYCLLVVLLFPVLAHAGPASQQLQKSIDQVIELLKDKTLDTTVRRDRLRVLIEQRFDFRTMSQFALSIEWRNATPAQRDDFVQRFTRMVESSYLGRLEQYSDQKVDIRDERLRGGKAVVKTVILSKNVDIPIDYKMHRTADDWRIYDVQIEGVSLVRNYRDSYRTIAKNEGISGLLKRMDEKLAELEANKAAAPN